MTLNYIGSKKKLIDFLDIPISKIVKDNMVFLDGFAGTGIVGNSFYNKYNLSIIANDLEYYGYIINYSQLCVSYSKKLEKIIDEINKDLINFKENESKEIDNYNLITQNYSPKGCEKRKYWTINNAMKADYIRYKIDKLKEGKKIDNNEHIYLIGCLLVSIDVIANTACVYGAYLKNFKKSAEEDLILKPIHKNENVKNNKVFNTDINSDTIYNQNYDICYLDPPYNNRQYSANYHPLNYIAHYDKNLEIYGKTGLIKNYNKSKYCNKSNAIDMLTELIDKLKTKHILLSYNNEGIMNFDIIKELLINKGKVILYKKAYKKFKSNSTQKNEDIFEYLFHCEISNDKSFTEIII